MSKILKLIKVMRKRNKRNLLHKVNIQVADNFLKEKLEVSLPEDLTWEEAVSVW